MLFEDEQDVEIPSAQMAYVKSAYSRVPVTANTLGMSAQNSAPVHPNSSHREATIQTRILREICDEPLECYLRCSSFFPSLLFSVGLSSTVFPKTQLCREHCPVRKFNHPSAQIEDSWAAPTN